MESNWHRSEIKMETMRKRLRSNCKRIEPNTKRERKRLEWRPKRNANRNEAKATRQRANWVMKNARSTTAFSIEASAKGKQTQQRTLRGGRSSEIQNNAVRVLCWDISFLFFFNPPRRIIFAVLANALCSPWLLMPGGKFSWKYEAIL